MHNLRYNEVLYTEMYEIDPAIDRNTSLPQQSSRFMQSFRRIRELSNSLLTKHVCIESFCRCWPIFISHWPQRTNNATKPTELHGGCEMDEFVGRLIKVSGRGVTG